MSPDAELVIYRVAQEALTNVVRHARTQAADVTLAVHDHEVELRVHDDGLGVREHTAEDSAGGIRGMRDVRLHVPLMTR